MLGPTDEVRSAFVRLLEIRLERQRLEPEKQRLKREQARLGKLYDDLTTEEHALESMVKLAIGPAKGIDGVATWQTVDGRRRFDPDWLKADQPELFEAYRTAFDGSRFRKERLQDYSAHMRVTRVRLFHWSGELSKLEGVGEDDGGEPADDAVPSWTAKPGHLSPSRSA